MRWFYNKDKQGVIAEKQPKGYHYNFRGQDLLRITSDSEEKKKAEELDEAREKYRLKFGKKAHHFSSKKTLLEALNNDS